MMNFVCLFNSRACWIKFSLNCSRWWFQRFFMFTLILGNDPVWLIFFRWVEATNQCFFFSEKGGISGRFGKMFSRSAGTFNTRYLMTRRCPKKYELSCVFQDSSISHYYLSNLMYSHFWTSGFWLVSPCYYIIFLTKKKIQLNPNPNLPPRFSPVSWNQVNLEVKFSIPPYVSLLARSVATLEGVALQGDPQWRGVMDGWMVKVIGR